jgi:hypothetical protein
MIVPLFSPLPLLFIQLPCLPLGSGFVGRRFSDDSLGGLMPSEFPAILVGAAAPGPEVPGTVPMVGPCQLDDGGQGVGFVG